MGIYITVEVCKGQNLSYSYVLEELMCQTVVLQYEGKVLFTF